MLRKWAAERTLTLSRVGLCVWAALIVVGSLIPRVPGPIRIFLVHGADKVAHGVAYAVLCLLLIWAAAPLRRRTRFICSAVGAALFGGLIELLQPLTGRTCDLADMGFNTLGILGALLVIALTGGLSRTDAAKTADS
jgi:hypothetical protein